MGAALDSADFAALARDASRHGLAAVTRNALVAAGVELPKTANEALRHQVLAGSAGAMKVKRLLLRALDGLQAVGVRPVLLKGFALASRIYPDPFLRPTSDVDLLLAPEELELACSVMPSLGLSPKLDSDDFYPSAYQHHRTFAGPPGMDPRG
ncbi:MAG: nucleotidyltransferase family protein, partial [Myxococcaceae bacterium]